MSSGFENSKEWLNFLVSVLNLIATISIPFLLWWYSKQQEKQQERQAAQQRLKDHVGQLTAAGGAAQGVIVYFRDDCRCVVAASVAGASTASAHSTC
jgi:plastocyanin domain-containing protein